MRQARRSHCREALTADADRYPQQRLYQCDNLSASSNSEQIHTPPLHVANLGCAASRQRTVGGSRDEDRGRRDDPVRSWAASGRGFIVTRRPDATPRSPPNPGPSPPASSGPADPVQTQAYHAKHTTRRPPPAASTAARRHWQAAGGVAHTVSWPPRLWRADRLLYHC